MKYRRPNNFDPFTDLLFNILLGFTFLFFITILFINPISKLGNVNLKAEYIITVDWQDNLPDDVDIWVQDPNGEIVSYLKKDAGWLHLDRDDQGIINDVVQNFPIGVSSINYLLLCSIALFIRSRTLMPNLMYDWVFFVVAILIISSIHYSILTVIFDIPIRYGVLMFNSVLTFLVYPLFSKLFYQIYLIDLRQENAK